MRVGLPAVMALIVLGLVGWVVASTLQAPKPLRIEDPIIRMVGARFQGRTEDGRSFLIGARQAVRDEREANSVALIEPIMVVGAETPTPRRIMARKGTYDEKTRLLRAPASSTLSTTAPPCRQSTVSIPRRPPKRRTRTSARCSILCSSPRS